MHRRRWIPVHGVCGAHGGHETAEVRDVRRTHGGCELRRGLQEYERMRSPERDEGNGAGQSGGIWCLLTIFL